jgi:hypothetical protein
MFQRSYHEFTAVSPRCSLQRTRSLCFSVAYIQVSSANRAGWVPGATVTSFIYRLHNIGARTAKTLNIVSVGKEGIGLMRLVENCTCNSDNLYSGLECHVVSKALSISKNTADVHILLLKFRVTWSVSLMHWSLILWSARKPNWHIHVFGKFLPSVCFRVVLKVSFSSSLPVVDKRLIGGKFWIFEGFSAKELAWRG